MKKIFALFALMATLSTANAQIPLDMKLIEEVVNNEKQYFRDIIKVFNTDDPYIRLDDIAIVYYGYAFTPEYNPAKDENEKLLNKYITESNYPMIYKTAQKILSYNPSSLKALFYAWNSGKAIGKSDDEYFPYMNRFMNVLNMIKEYGNGKSANTAFKITHPNDMIHVMHSLHINGVVSESFDPTTKCSIITIEPSKEFQHRHIYFDISLFLDNETKKK